MEEGTGMIDGRARKTRLAVVDGVVDVVGDLGLGEQTVVTGSCSSPSFLFLPRFDLVHI